MQRDTFVFNLLLGAAAIICLIWVSLASPVRAESYDICVGSDIEPSGWLCVPVTDASDPRPVTAAYAPPSRDQIGITDRELDYFARTLWGEARGQDDAEVLTIAHVILNRVRSRKFPDSIEAVVTEPWQFSCWNADDPNREPMRRLSRASAAYRRMEALALQAIDERAAGIDRARTAMHYHHRPAGDEPSWTEAAAFSFQEGDARLYRLNGGR